MYQIWSRSKVPKEFFKFNIFFFFQNIADIATVQKSQPLMWHIMAPLSFLDLEIRQSKFGGWLRMIFCRLLVQSILVTGFGHWLPQRPVVLP